MYAQRITCGDHVYSIDSPSDLIYYFVKGGESSSQFRWFTIAKIEL